MFAHVSDAQSGITYHRVVPYKNLLENVVLNQSVQAQAHREGSYIMETQVNTYNVSGDERKWVFGLSDQG